MNNINIGWKSFIDTNIEEINNILDNLDYDNQIIYPSKENIFRALFYFPPEDIKLIILGQDPYIKENQACGLSFSVPNTQKKIPPSLKNIFKEIKNSYPEYVIPKDGSLERWTQEEKILLLNSALTVLEGKSNSHAKLWYNLTDKLIKYISENNSGTIFLLMGNFAINKEILIDQNKHKIFKTVHPSPLSANRGFFGSNIFKKINDYLIDKINW
jgi:uracil-DNA glycosylase